MLQTTHNTWLRRLAFSQPLIFSILVILISGLLTEIPLNQFFEPWLEAPVPELLKVTIGHTLTGLLLV